MLKRAVFVIAAVAAMPALAQSSEASSSKEKDPNRKICEKITKIGSRLATVKVCMTAAEWEEVRRGQRNDLEAVQRIVNQNPSK